MPPPAPFSGYLTTTVQPAAAALGRARSAWRCGGPHGGGAANAAPCPFLWLSDNVRSASLVLIFCFEADRPGGVPSGTPPPCFPHQLSPTYLLVAFAMFLTSSTTLLVLLQACFAGGVGLACSQSHYGLWLFGVIVIVIVIVITQAGRSRAHSAPAWVREPSFN
jgi:hypothetical protein